MMKLHCFGESGHSYKAAMALALTDSEWEPVYIDFFNGGSKTPEYLALNEMGEAPVLIDGDTVLSQSGVILDYISSKTGKLGGRSADARREVLRWMFFDNHKISSNAGTLRYMLNFLPEEKRNADIIAFLTARLKGGLATIEGHLANHQWLAGDDITVADLSNAAYLFYPEPFNFDRADFPNIDGWLDRIAAQPGWKSAYDLMPGNPADRA